MASSLPAPVASSKGLECYVKEEFLLPKKEKEEPVKHEDSKGKENGENGDDQSEKDTGGNKKKRGTHKKRPIFKVKNKDQLCSNYMSVLEGQEPYCRFENCKYSHDVKAYLENKPPDIGESCYVYSTLGFCPRGATCRFSKQHIDQDFRNLTNKQIFTGEKQELNHSSTEHRDTIMKLRKKLYDFSKADEACNRSFEIMRQREAREKEESEKEKTDAEESSVEAVEHLKEVVEAEDVNVEVEPIMKKAKLDEEMTVSVGDDKTASVEEKKIGPAPDEDLIRLRPEERRKLDWKDKLYLAPLTTVGNLPFRRLCKKLGADITCSEMALGLPLLQGHAPEWALMQRHHTEDFFGVQVCGCSPPQMSRVAQLLEERVECDFVDINLGCPIDLIFKKGMGSGLMLRKRPLEIISRTMAGLMTRPLTIKMRTGVYKDKNVAHDVFPRLENLGVEALTIHGRSREQRYTKVADWDYIKQCKETVDIPVFGNGDVLNFEDYYANKEKSGVDGIMIARGALIKPWIFTEIKERRHWDISGQERLDLVKDFANFGLEHWGSDDRGVETTRKFILEWMSFQYRYVPYGILKCPPQRLNERLPAHGYRGRDDLESLLSSNNGQDWVKITEMFLGKVKDGFEFLPRHKANSYSS